MSLRCQHHRIISKFYFYFIFYVMSFTYKYFKCDCIYMSEKKFLIYSVRWQGENAKTSVPTNTFRPLIFPAFYVNSMGLLYGLYV